MTIGGLTHNRDDLVRAFRAVDEDGDGSVSRGEWRRATAHDWRWFCTWPLLMALFTGLFFWVGFHERIEPESSS